jgi:hypothetical protein
MEWGSLKLYAGGLHICMTELMKCIGENNDEEQFKNAQGIDVNTLCLKFSVTMQ